MVSDKFRYQLRKEAQKWHDEGLIGQEIYEQLANRYNFYNLDTSSNHRFLAVIITLGFILLGLSVITFVAANWQVWSKPIKVSILIALFIAINTTGFYLYREKSADSKSRLGQGLLLLGGLTLGANIGLMSQMFHQTGAVYKLFLFWGFGVLLMAYTLRLTSLGVLALIIVGISYFSTFDENFILSIEMQLMPLLVGVLFGCLAYWCNSRWLFGLTLILWLITFNINVMIFLGENPQFFPGLILAGAAAIPPAFLWAYQDNLRFVNDSSIKFASINRKIAIFYLGLLFYILSFNFWWDANLNDQYKSNLELSINSKESLILLVINIFLVITIWLWWKLGRSQRRNDLWRVDRNSAAMGIIILTSAFLVWWHIQIYHLGEFVTFMFNVMLFLLAVGLIQQSVKLTSRLGYWWGIILLSLQLLSRMLEYNTGLLFKAIVLFVCGISVIIAGIWFETHFRQLQQAGNSED